VRFGVRTQTASAALLLALLVPAVARAAGDQEPEPAATPDGAAAAAAPAGAASTPASAADAAAASSPTDASPAASGPQAAGLAAYLDDRWADAIAAWRPLVEAGAADGVLLYRYSYALDESGAAASAVKGARRKAKKLLEKTAESGGPVACYYLVSLQEKDRDADRLAGACYQRFRSLAEGDDPETIYFVARLAAHDEALRDEQERLLRRALQRTEVSRSAWLRSMVRDLADLLEERDHKDEAIAVVNDGLQRLPGNAELLRIRLQLYWTTGRFKETEADARSVLERRPDSGAAWADLAFALWALDRYDEAIPAFHKAIDLGDARASPLNGLGLTLLALDRVPEAVTAFRDAMARDRSWSRPCFNLGQALARLDNRAGAEKEMLRAIDLDPKEWDYYQGLGSLRDDGGDREGALRTYREALAAGAPEAPAREAMGILLTRAGRAAEAIEPLQRAVQLQPEQASYRRALGSALEALQRYDEAEAAYREAIRIDPEEAVYHGYLASLLQDLHRNDEALQEFHRAEELAPDYAFAVEQTAVILAETGGDAEVIAYLEPRLERFAKNGSILRRAAIAYHQSGRVQEADRLLRQAIALKPPLELAFDSLALVVRDEEHLDEALDLLRQGLALYPDSVWLLFRLGSFLDMADRPQEALAPLQKVTTLHPEVATAWNSLGAVYDHLGRTDEAIAAFTRATELRSGFTLATLNLARVCRKAGRRAEAITHFQEALREDPKQPDIWSLLAEQLVLEKRLDEAEDAIKRGLALQPEHPGLHNVRGDLLVARGDEEGALAAFRAAEEVATDNDYPFRQEFDLLGNRQDDLGRLEATDRWLQRFPKSELALRQRGTVLVRLDRWADAEAAYRAAIELTADDWLAWTGLGDVAFNQEQWEEARSRYEHALALRPGADLTRAYMADCLRHLGRADEAIDAYRRALRTENGARHRIALAGLLRERGRPDEAEAVLQEGLQGRPASTKEDIPALPAAEGDEAVRLRRALADLYEATGRPQRALPVLRAVAEALPTDLQARRDLARALRGTGDLAASARVLEEALRLDADDQESLAMLRALPKGVADVDAFLKSVRPAPLTFDPVDVEAALHRQRPEDAAQAALIGDAGFVGLEDQIQVQVREGGLLTQTVHQVLRPLDQSTADALGEYRIAWVPDREQLEVHVARTHLPDGRVIDASPEAYHHVAPADTETQNMYSDSQVLIISLPQVQPGCAIEVQYTKKMKSTLTERQWWMTWMFQGGSPYLRSRLALRAPKDSEVHQAIRGAIPPPEVRDDGDQTIRIWTMDDIPALRMQPQGPPALDLHASLRLGSYSTWDQVATWFQGLIRGRDSLDENESAAIRRLLEGAGTPLQKVDRLYAHLQKTVRYVSVDLGIGSYQPHRASETLRNRYGDCKDRGTLFIAMLRAAGLRALPALVGTRDGGAVVHEVPSPGVFNHFIVYLPDVAPPTGSGDAKAAGLFVDATTEHNDLGVLPAAVQGVEAFVIDEGKGRFIRTPVAPARVNRRSLQRVVQVAADRSATITDDGVSTGSFASLIREILAGFDERGRREFMVKSARDEFPAATDVTFDLQQLDLPGGPPRDRETFRVPDFASPVGSSWVFAFRVLDILEPLLPVTPAADRRLDYQADVPMTLEEDHLVRLPPGRVFVDWPEAIHTGTPHARFDLEFLPEGARPARQGGSGHAAPALRVRARFVLSDRIIPLADYPAFAALVERALAAGHVTLIAR
jgi:tetratricopeptide (TPR) repeat protein